MPWQQTRFRVRAGLTLLVRVLTPNQPVAGRMLFFIHGVCEHGGRYQRVAEHLAARGWTCVIPDHRGHGESEGSRADVATIDEYLDDLRQVRDEFCGTMTPAILSHSFGGLLAARMAQLGPVPRALVLSAPLLGVSLPVPWWKWWLGRALCLVAPQTRFRTGINPYSLSRDPEVLAQRKADPLIQRHITARWFFAMQRGLQEVQRDAGRITCPVLALQGLADRTVNPDAVRAWWDRLGSTRKELIELPDHVHELLNEPDWLETTDRIAGWLEAMTE
jgi:acylglycerol lipase